MPLVAIAVGGACGAVARYGMASFVQRLLTQGSPLFPYGTLAVNLLGCLLLGALVPLLGDRVAISAEVRLALTVGFLGAFTTFSTYGVETLTLAQSGLWKAVVANVLLSNFLGLGAAWLGYACARRLF